MTELTQPLNIQRYNTGFKQQWDACVTNASNSHFLFYRDYMEYHSDRFTDYSLMVMSEDKVIAVLPASVKDDIVNSHAGLTFGGLIYSKKITAPKVICALKKILEYYRQAEIKKLIYKPSPFTYHSVPSEADLYALHHFGGHITEMHLATSIDYTAPKKFSGGRKNQIQRAKKNNIQIVESNDWDAFFDLLTNVLQTRHSASPVHTASEMHLLHSRFPENIKLWLAKKDDEILAGSVLYITGPAVHTQYLASSDKGRYLGALDLLLSELIDLYAGKKRYFCFGKSTEGDGTVLNEGLLYQKESFGGRSVVHNIWEINLD